LPGRSNQKVLKYEDLGSNFGAGIKPAPAQKIVSECFAFFISMRDLIRMPYQVITEKNI